MAIFSRFFGRTVGEGAGVAIGTATANVVEPALQELANAAWAEYPYRPLEPDDAAALRARETLPDYPGIDLGGVDPSHEARYGGMRQKRFDALTELQREHPSVGELITLRRRRLALGGTHGIGQGEFREWLRRGGFTADVIDALTKLLATFLSPEDIANAVQQGFVPGDDLLPPPESGGPPFEPPTEQVPIDPSNEAAVHGVDRDRLKVLAELSGNPPGPETLLELWNRGAITERAVDRGIREGRTKTKWTPAIKELAKRLLSPATLVNLRLRGWIDEDTYVARMSRHGYTRDRAIDWYLSAGRPAAPGQMFQAWARGVEGPDGRPMDREQFLKGIRESDIRPEWGPVLWGVRYAYPSLFQLRRAVQDGSISPERALTILRFERYEDRDAQGLVRAWQAGTGTAQREATKAEILSAYETGLYDVATATAQLRELGETDEAIAVQLGLRDYRVVRSSLTAAMTKTRTLYTGWRVARLDASNELDALGIPATARERALAVWDHERELNRPDLTPAQIVKAAKKHVWTGRQAFDELRSRGYTDRDAGVLLASDGVTID